MKAAVLFLLPLLTFCPVHSSGEDALDPPYGMKEIVELHKLRLLAPSESNPRNSEGDFIQLEDGRILFIYTHFTGGGSDHAAGHLASRYSDDGGQTWSTEDRVVIPREGAFNNMSVSLLRLQTGEIALFYLIKESLTDCRPFLRLSMDEAATWSDPISCIDDEIGYYVLNNDRVIQLESGRLLFAVSQHNVPGNETMDMNGKVMTYFSDDRGASWTRGKSLLVPEDQTGKRLIAQEPGLVELKDGTVLMFIRSNAGSQLFSHSSDGGDTWTDPVPSPLRSPVSPATIERIPSTGDLLAVWNDHGEIPAELKGKRTPFTLAISSDEGKTWTRRKTIEDDPNGWYCYTAMDFLDGHVILGHCAGDRRTGGLNLTQITKIPIDWIYSSKVP